VKRAATVLLLSQHLAELYCTLQLYQAKCSASCATATNRQYDSFLDAHIILHCYLHTVAYCYHNASTLQAIAYTLSHIVGEIVPAILLIVAGLPLGMSPFLVLFVGEYNLLKCTTACCRNSLTNHYFSSCSCYLITFADDHYTCFYSHYCYYHCCLLYSCLI
jgi:hypothetical protein